MEQYAVEFKHLTKVFPGVRALDDVSFGIKKGEVHAIVGENGAGKSTLLNILHGVLTGYEGDVLINGAVQHFTSPSDAFASGVAKVHQEVSLVDALTVGQNISLGYEPKKNTFAIDYKKLNKDANEVLDKLGCQMRSESRLASLSIGEKQMIAIAKALYHNAQIISFDEPTSSLTNVDTERLFRVIEEMKSQGMTILYISHRMDEIFRIADRITILRDGKYVNTLAVDECTKESLMRSMVGRDVSAYARRMKPLCATDEVVLKVEGLSGKGFENISFDLRKGEILGLSGLVGAGRTEIIRAAIGADEKYDGKIILRGKEIDIKSPKDALKNGIGLLPEDRKKQGFIPVMDNKDNIALTSLSRFIHNGFMSNKEKTTNFSEFAERVKLNNRNPQMLTVNLSGGNQQKVILAKWLSTQVDILIFDEPTKGIDVGAKEEIYSLMEDFVSQGKSIIMISSELTEIMGMSDRVIVVKSGEITAELNRDELSEETIMVHSMEA